ncbi:Spy Predicted O-linked N-acetylglucosamine transferase, SPINDLY family [Candidatus Pelagibacterales bacterium]
MNNSKERIEKISYFLKNKNFDDAKYIIDQLILEQPNNTDFLNILGVIFLETEKYLEAEKIFKSILDFKPNSFEAYYNLGFLNQKLLNFNKALHYYLQANIINKNNYSLLNKIALIYFKIEDVNLSIKFYNQSLKVNNVNVEAYNNLGRIYLDYFGDINLAIHNFSSAIKILPQADYLHRNLGRAYKIAGVFDKAKISLNTSIVLNPKYSEAYWDLGDVHAQLHEYRDAKENLFQALKLDQKFNKNKNNYKILRAIGSYYMRVRDYNNAVVFFEKSLAIKKDYSDSYSNLLFTYNYLEQSSKNKYIKTLNNFSANTRKFNLDSQVKIIKNSQEKLNIGFVSGDFVDHPVGYFLEKTLLELKDKVNLFAYSTSFSETELTKDIKKYFFKWNVIMGKRSEDIINLIRNDKIDILFDLSGHTKNNILPLFENRLAPIQVAWIGYLASTGLSNMDYLISDRVICSEDNEEFFTENLWKMPNIWNCYSSPNFVTEINKTAPFERRGFVTFGSFNNYLKYNNNLIKTWSSILGNINNSKILLIYNGIDSSEIRQSIINDYLKFGVSEDKIILKGFKERKDLLEMYNDVDIALDPFPYNGGSTSFEASWMGCPLLTKKGKTFLSRCGESININLNMREMIAEDEQDYINKAVQIADNKETLLNLRKKLLLSSRQSNLFNTKLFSENFYQMLLDMKKIYLEKNSIN